MCVGHSPQCASILKYGLFFTYKKPLEGAANKEYESSVHTTGASG